MGNSAEWMTRWIGRSCLRPHIIPGQLLRCQALREPPLLSFPTIAVYTQHLLRFEILPAILSLHSSAASGFMSIFNI